MGNFEFFSLNLANLPNYVQYFSSYNIENVAESWMDAEASLVEADEAGWRQMELHGGGESWVEVGAWFSNTHTRE